MSAQNSTRVPCVCSSGHEKDMKFARNQSIASRYILAKLKPEMLSRLFIPDLKTNKPIFCANYIRTTTSAGVT